MLEKILNYEGPVEWHEIDKNFEKHFKETGHSNFYRSRGEIICCSSCARDNPKFTNYEFFLKGYEEYPISCSVSREFDKGDFIYALFEFDEKGILHGWINSVKFYYHHLSKKERSALWDDFRKLNDCLFEDNPKRRTSVLKKQIYERLSKSKNPKVKRKLKEIKSKYGD